MRTLPQFVPSQFVVGLLSLAAVSLSLPSFCEQRDYEIETNPKNR